MKLISWNVNGLRAAEKKGFLDWLAACGADVVAVQETKAQPEQLSAALRAPAGWRTDWFSAEKKGYSGVGTYTRPQPLSVHGGFGEARFDHEGRVLRSEYPAFTFFNIYFPNGGRGPEWVRHKLDFYRAVLGLARQLMAAGRPVIITGDLNTSFADIDLARPKENVAQSGFMPEERAALGEYFDAGLVDTFRRLHPALVKYTWWNQVTRSRERNVGWRLDYFLVSPDLAPRVTAADCLTEVPGSDHCPVTLELDL